MKKMLSILLPIALASAVAFAADYNLREITPEVQKALDGRRDRYGLLDALKDQGKIGEGRDGFLVNLTGDADADRAVSQENRDRKVIYNAIVKQNHLPETEIHPVKRVFAETQRMKAKTGQMIQLETGEWVKQR